jgi:hypothetical protein
MFPLLILQNPDDGPSPKTHYNNIAFTTYIPDVCTVQKISGPAQSVHGDSPVKACYIIAAASGV